ncbi:MAG: (deoxy)nucleoside triphosphate pyrophosphohydrolase [Sphingomonadaceae bacterium]|uniref:(deoxy)nucleoside triphosphate pyrophosphohydrolase n=1 Tax=Thermaurantiacus sp. TaxID=2820283 RepID=UPI00298F106A|nr:(deoxy)nucleoside triphosphate pyrophosphohydrolase [Thermaurantiacus sp.]MCS6987374.1 (deoxy)nucleoside triphosphate pyrophosphohydrolase [Sphingomonadaceae bacterium]MDW8415292.1 (deoxy)nucleoside triphosphate pyrophosphohydrolase [Thermaurantiacus sp.]
MADARPDPTGRPVHWVACAVMVDPDGRVLVAERPPGRPMAGLWEFPGGKIEPGEAPEAALVRELAEELGVVAAPACLSPCGFASEIYPEAQVVLLAFALRRWEGRPTPREGQRLRWVRLADLFTLPMPPADRPLLGQLASLL